MTNEARERNQRISENILLGGSVTEIARIYGITRGRCIQILRAYCSSKDRDVYISITGSISCPPRLKELREYVDVFLSNDFDEELLTLNSPIWKVKEFPRKIVNALERNEIRTVEELLKVDVAMLKRLPMIGSVSIERIECFTEQYKHQDGQAG